MESHHIIPVERGSGTFSASVPRLPQHDLESPAFPPEALDITIDTLVAIARYRHGDLAVLLALSRRERDTLNALRVF